MRGGCGGTELGCRTGTGAGRGSRWAPRPSTWSQPQPLGNPPARPLNRSSIVICSRGGPISKLAPPSLPWQPQRCQATLVLRHSYRAGWLCRSAGPAPCFLQVPRSWGLG